jgi:hypothetical protein
MKVTRTPWDGIIENDVLAPRSAVPAGLVLQGHAQVIDASAKPLLQPELKGGHERLNHAVIHPSASVWNKDAQGFRSELSVQVEAVDKIGRVIRVAFGTFEGVILCRCALRTCALGACAPRCLHFSTVPAKRETRPGGGRGSQVRVLPGAPIWPDSAKSRIGQRNSATIPPLTATGRNLPTEILFAVYGPFQSGCEPRILIAIHSLPTNARPMASS